MSELHSQPVRVSSNSEKIPLPAWNLENEISENLVKISPYRPCIYILNNYIVFYLNVDSLFDLIGKMHNRLYTKGVRNCLYIHRQDF